MSGFDPLDKIKLMRLFENTSAAIIEGFSVLKEIKEAIANKPTIAPRWITEGGLTFDLNEVAGVGSWHLALYPDSPQGIRIVFKNGTKLDSIQLGKKQTLEVMAKIDRLLNSRYKPQPVSPPINDEQPFE